jgi:hypothetical protein
MGRGSHRGVTARARESQKRSHNDHRYYDATNEFRAEQAITAVTILDDVTSTLDTRSYAVLYGEL